MTRNIWCGSHVHDPTQTMATFNNVLIKQRSVIELLVAEGCSEANNLAIMKTVYALMFMSDSTVRKWVRIFKGEEDPRETIVRYRKRSSRPLSASDMAHREEVKFLEQGQTVISERYISTLRTLKLRLRRVLSDKNSFLQHDMS